MRYIFISRESNWMKRYHVDKYVGVQDGGRMVAFERQVPFRRKKEK